MLMMTQPLKHRQTDSVDDVGPRSAPAEPDEVHWQGTTVLLRADT